MTEKTLEKSMINNQGKRNAIEMDFINNTINQLQTVKGKTMNTIV